MVDYDGIAADYARHRQLHPEVLRALAAAVQNTTRLLEVGCGTGNYIVALQTLAGCPCWAIDPSEPMLARARRRSDRIWFQAGRAEQLAFAPESFHLVFSVDVIHHVGDRAAYFREAYRVLTPGGKVCTVTDCEWIIRNRQPLADYFPETVAIDLGRYPADGELDEAMRQAGFGAIERRRVEFRYDLTDLGPYRDRAFSCLRLLADDAFRRGLGRMEEDLHNGPIPCISRYELVWGTKGTAAHDEESTNASSTD
jgi:ubiquinone/menaquinone biosynthesis C-methylase UbiE